MVNCSSLWRGIDQSYCIHMCARVFVGRGAVVMEWNEMNGLTEDERRVGLFEPGEVPKVGRLAELVASWVK